MRSPSRPGTSFSCGMATSFRRNLTTIWAAPSGRPAGSVGRGETLAAARGSGRSSADGLNASLNHLWHAPLLRTSDPRTKERLMKGDAATGLQELVRDAVHAEVGGLFDEMRRFLDRRIAELSTEILATLEMVDVNETHLSDQLQQMHGEISRVMALPT